MHRFVSPSASQITHSIARRAINYHPNLTDQRLRDHLLTARQSGRLVLVLGAGISFPSGLDTWQSLVHNAAAKLFANTAFADLIPILNAGQKSPIIQIRFCESLAKLKTAFRVFLCEALYRNYDPGRQNVNLESRSTLILGLDGDRQIPDVITYNFDDLLERALAKKIKDNRRSLNIIPTFRKKLIGDRPETAAFGYSTRTAIFPSIEHLKPRRNCQSFFLKLIITGIFWITRTWRTQHPAQCFCSVYVLVYRALI